MIPCIRRALACSLCTCAVVGAAWATPSPPAVAARLLARAGEVIEAHAAGWGVRPQDLAFEDVRTAGQLTHIFYRQYCDGLPVVGAATALTFAADGRLVWQDGSLAPDIDLNPPAAPIALAVAQSSALQAVPPVRAVEWWQGELAVLPQRGDNAPHSRLIWRLGCRTFDPPGVWRFAVDAETGTVLEQKSLVYPTREPAIPESLSGRVLGTFHQPTPYGPRRTLPLPHLAIAALEDTTVLAATFTDSSGWFNLGQPVADTLILRSALEGRHARIHPEVLGASPTALTLIDPVYGGEVHWDSTAASLAEIEAYANLETAHAHLKSTSPGFGAWLDLPLPLVVNDSTLSCNALTYGDPVQPWIRFSAGRAGCTNMARIADVVYHEYSHLITLYDYLPDDAPDNLREAFSDFFAASLADTSRIGLDWAGPGTWLRDLDHELTWPVTPACAEQPHCVGQLLAGALWEMRTALIGELGDRQSATRLADRLFEGMRAAKPRDFQSCLVHLLLQDDDDGDLTDGTPHLAAIAQGFARHRIGDFSVQIIHTPLADTAEADLPREIRVGFRAIYPLDPQALRLHYRIDGGPVITIALTGSRWEYSGVIPATPAGSEVSYYLSAADLSGHAATLPAGAPSEAFRYTIGPDLIAPAILHVPATDPAVDQAGLWLSATVTDNAHAIDSVLVMLTVNGVEIGEDGACVLSPKAPGAHPGLYAGYVPLGTLQPDDLISYVLRAVDGSPAANEARFPSSSAIRLTARRGRAWDLEPPAGSADLALEPGWVWCEPDSADLSGLYPAPSGSHVLAAIAGAGTPPGSLASFTTPSINVAGWSAARLEVNTWYHTPEGSAGASILVSSDDGGTWQELLPPLRGESPWRHLTVPLDAFVNQALRLRFVYSHGTARAGDGWSIDDLKVVEAPALPPPVDLVASQGEAGRVALRWSPPEQLDPGASDLIRYQVYRGPRPGDYAPAALNPEPIAETEWVDTQVTDGERYYYAVTARSSRGESSPSGEAIGYPYRSALEAPARLERNLGTEDTGQDTVAIANTGTGILRFDLYHADAQQTWSDRVIVLRRPGPPFAFETLAQDPPGDAAIDLRYLAYREVSPHVIFRIGFHEPLPDPHEDFTVMLLLDTDLTLSTGYAGVNIGADYVIALGRMIDRATGGQALGYVLNGAFEFVAPPSSLILYPGADSLEVSVPWQVLGSPESLACAVRIIPSDGPTLGALASEGAAVRELTNAELQAGDWMPDPPTSTWLHLGARSGSATPGMSFPLELAYDLSGRPEAHLEARVLLRSNDPAAGVHVLSVGLDHSGPDVVRSLSLECPRPNPFRSETSFTLRIPDGVAWRLDVVDVAGRLVRRIAAGPPGNARTTLLSWDARQEDQTLAASGVYYAVARAGHAKAACGVLFIR